MCLQAAQSQSSKPEEPFTSNDIPKQYTAPSVEWDYIRRVEMVPMRDGVKLQTFILVPKGATKAPILLTVHAFTHHSVRSVPRAPR